MKKEDIDFEYLVDKLWKPTHTGKCEDLMTCMLANKLKYVSENGKFDSYENEIKWMADYLRNHWED